MKFFLVFLMSLVSMKRLATSMSIESKRDTLYAYIYYQNQKIENYFLVVGFENDKIKFIEIDQKAIFGLQYYLNLKKNVSGTLLIKTSESCIEPKSENEVKYSLDREYFTCRRSSLVESLGSTSLFFWLKKIYFTYRDFVDWL